VIAAEYASLDGVMEDPGPTGEFEHRGWTMPYWNDELAKDQSDLLFASEALLLGRVTYDEFVASWPLRSGDPFTDRMNSMPKFVASRSLQEPLEWNATLLKGDVAEEVQTLKQQPGGSLLIYGSGELVRHANAAQPYRCLSGHALSAHAGERQTTFCRRGGQDHANTQQHKNNQRRCRSAYVRGDKNSRIRRFKKENKENMIRVHKQVLKILLLIGFTLASQPIEVFPQQDSKAAQTTSQSSAERDGQHDFDWELGHWKLHTKRLQHPLTGSSDWIELNGTVDVRKI